ncbi:MAG: glycogenin glucosyltransferase [Thelocarpon superellum]|nr:MAG: glycogenin glucosyltransferase [Thelocarpon superellum]
MASAQEDVYCTLVMSDNYLPGATVLAHSLRDAGTKKKLAVLVTLETLQASTVTVLKELYDHVLPVPRVVNQFPANLYLMERPELHSTFTKINLWQLEQFRKIVYVDADVVAVRAPDELFDVPATFAAAPDTGWPDCFNSGVMVLSPGKGDYYALLALAQRGISFDGADQGLLNMHFKPFHRLSFAYNCTPSGHYQYVPAYRHFQSSISLVHFIGHEKPWLQGRDSSNVSSVYNELLGRWWSVYDRHYRAPSGDVQAPTVRKYVRGEPVENAKDPKREPEPIAVAAEEPADILGSESKCESSVARKVAPSRMSEWDPARSGPPSNSAPEAPNFPQTTYEMSDDAHFFRAPAYPEPPTSLTYQIPETPPAGSRPKPIFPWEINAPKPTRVFDDEPTSPPPPSSTLATPSATDDEARDDMSTSTTPSASTTTADWNNFSSSNAWDGIPEIDQAVSNIMQQRKGQVQVLQGGLPEEVGSPGIRRPGVRVTDFPSEIERPSLPVTPAPVRRPSFWGSERDRDGELPAAEGVPAQEDWDPSLRLEELTRRQPEVFPSLQSPPEPRGPNRTIPQRDLPGSAAPISPSSG